MLTVKDRKLNPSSEVPVRITLDQALTGTVPDTQEELAQWTTEMWKRLRGPMQAASKHKAKRAYNRLQQFITIAPGTRSCA